MKLTIDLVPKTTFYSNVRSILPKSTWNKIRIKTIADANNVCEVCGGVTGYRGLDCHEIWEFDTTTYTKRLTKIIALCNKCHEVKHIGLAELRGNFDRAKKWFMEINDISDKEADYLIDDAFQLWDERNQHQWQTDISILEEYKK